MEKFIILDGFLFMAEEDRKFVDSLKLTSDDMFRIFKIVVAHVLGIKIIKWHFDCEKCQTTICFE